MDKLTKEAWAFVGDGEANEVKRPGCGSLGITTSEPWVAQKLKYDGGDLGILLKGECFPRANRMAMTSQFQSIPHKVI